MRTHLLMAAAVAAALLAATSSARAQTNWTGTISTDGGRRRDKRNAYNH